MLTECRIDYNPIAGIITVNPALPAHDISAFHVMQQLLLQTMGSSVARSGVGSGSTFAIHAGSIPTAVKGTTRPVPLSPDGGLRIRSLSKVPFLVLEVGFSRSFEQTRSQCAQWLYHHPESIRYVVLLKFVAWTWKENKDWASLTRLATRDT